MAFILNVLNPMLFFSYNLDKQGFIDITSIPFFLDQSTRNPHRLVSTCQLHMLALKHKTNIKLVI